MTEREKEKLTGLEIDYNQLLKEEPNYGKDLKRILEKDRKYRRNKTVGIVLGGLGLATTVGGIIIMAEKDGNGLSRTIVGGGTAALGLIEMGISIPLLTSSKKKKKGKGQNNIGGKH